MGHQQRNGETAGDGVAATQSREPAIDPLRRVLVPREAVTPNGTTVFRTSDGTLYARMPDGSRRRVDRKREGRRCRRS